MDQLTQLPQLAWADLKRFGRFDGAGRWYPNSDIAEYFKGYRPPSRAWPSSYAKAATTKKFARWLTTARPDLLEQLIVTAVIERLEK